MSVRGRHGAGLHVPWARMRAEHELLFEALFVCAPRRERIRELAREPIRWERVAALAHAHAVPAAVFHTLQECEVGDVVPADIWGTLRDAHERTLVQNLVALRDAVEAQGALEARGIESLVIKGAALAATHYPTVATRHFDDVDLLVHDHEVHAAVDTLTASGFRPYGQIWFDGRSLDDVPGLRGHAAPGLVSPNGVLFEVHRRPPGSSGGPDAFPVWNAARSQEVAGGRLRVPADRSQLRIACDHVFDHHYGDWRLLARHIVDVHVLEAAGVLADADERRRWTVAKSCEWMTARGEGRAGRVFGDVAKLSNGASLSARQLVRVVRRDPRDVVRFLFPARAYMAWRCNVSPDTPGLRRRYFNQLLRSIR